MPEATVDMWEQVLQDKDRQVHSRKLTWKPKKGPVKTTVSLNGNYMGFHVSLGECIQGLGLGFEGSGFRALV